MSHRELFRVENVPAYQNKMFDTREAAKDCPLGDVVLVQDIESGLVFNAAFDPGRLEYDASYQNEQGLSDAFRRHMDLVLDKVCVHFRNDSVLEVGCGKGGFLDLMRQRGIDATGIDPAYEGDAPYIRKQHFDASTGLTAQAIVLRHVLEHIPDPRAFLRTIAAANGGRGKVYIEVPCLDWITRRRAWFDIFYEHVNYFRLSDFTRIFGKIHDGGHLFDGQYLYVIADLASLDPANCGSPPETVWFPTDFLAELDSLAVKRSTAISRAVWGAAAKGVMFTHHLESRGIRLDFAIDINPAKQGKFLAGSALPVLSPADGLARLADGDDVFVMNSNYIDEIVAAGGDKLNYQLADSR